MAKNTPLMPEVDGFFRSQKEPVAFFKKSETDGPWQEVLEYFFQPFMELCFPEWAKQVDWSYSYKTLKGEFPAKEGKQVCDMLFEVLLLNGQKKLILLHLEIQGQKQAEFAYRMASYNFTIFKKHKKPVVSVALLLDQNPHWRPDCFEQKHPFTQKPYLQFSFDTIKVLDYRGRQEELKKEKNLFAFVLLAQLSIIEAKGNQELRKKKKSALTRALFTQGFSKETVSALYKFIDWLIKLKPDYMKLFQEEIKESAERESWMDWDPVYVSTFEQVAKMKGHEEGLQEGLKEGLQEGLKEGQARQLIRQLQRRFSNAVTPKYLQLIKEADSETLGLWAENLMDATHIEDIFERSLLTH